MKNKSFGIKNFAHIANRYINPSIKTLEDMKQYLIGWFCIEFKTTMNDERLLDMTLEELLVLYQMHRIHNDPRYYESLTASSKKDYEEWLKEEMGEEYIDPEAQAAELEKLDKEYLANLKKSYPDRIDTDFSKVSE